MVEKDATFQRLLDDGVCSAIGPCVLITGKGVPDLNTRQLVRRYVALKLRRVMRDNLVSYAMPDREHERLRPVRK